MPLNNPPIGYSKVKIETKAMDQATGDVAYTGYGFRPTGIILLAYRDVTRFSIGSSEPALAEKCLYTDGVEPKGGGNMVYLGVAATNQAAVVKTYDPDGFTLTWTKTGLPTGTASLHVFAFL